MGNSSNKKKNGKKGGRRSQSSKRERTEPKLQKILMKKEHGKPRRLFQG